MMTDSKIMTRINNKIIDYKFYLILFRTMLSSNRKKEQPTAHETAEGILQFLVKGINNVTEI